MALEGVWKSSGEAIKKKKEEDKGVLAGAIGKAANVLSIGQVDEHEVAKQARGVTDMLNPTTVFPALAGAAIQQVKAVPTLATAGLGAAMGKSEEEILGLMDSSPASFALDSGNLRATQELRHSDSYADRFMGNLGAVTPVGKNLAEGMAGTGIRGGGMLASGVSQTGLAGPRRTANEMVEMFGGSAESLGEAGAKGQGGAQILGDILNIAPALKGATGGGALNPLANTAAAQKVAAFGKALETAPIAPITVPGRGIQEGIRRASLGAEAFPRLAESGLPGAASLSAGAEKLADVAGQAKAGHRIREEMMSAQAAKNAEIMPILTELQEKTKQAVAAGDDVAAQGFLQQGKDLQNIAKQEAMADMLPGFTRQIEKEAAEVGGNVVGTDAFSRIINEVDNSIVKQGKVDSQLHGLPRAGQVDEGLSSAAEFPEAMRGVGAPRQAAVEEAALREAGFVPESQQIGQAGRKLEQGLKSKYSDIEGTALKAEDKIPLVGATRQIPKNFTEDSIAAHMKGLDTPTTPPGFAGDALKGWDTLMGAWKTSVLPFRPAWHSANAIGNTMGAMLLGEVSPTWFAKNGKSLMEEFKNMDGAHWARPSLGRGIGAELENLATGQGKNVVSRGIKTGAEKSFKAAQSVDDFSHFVVAKSRFDKNIASGMSKEAAAREANSFSLKAMGDFGNMNAFERSHIRRIMPFYPWYKHTAKATMRFPLENPARFLQSQATAQRVQGGPQERAAGTDFLKGAMPLAGGQFLRMGGDIGLGFEGNPVLDPTSAIQGMAPPIQGMLAATGLSSRGRELDTGPGQNKASMATGYAINQTPLLRLAADLKDWGSGEGAMRRDDTRGIKVSDGRPVKNMNQDLMGRIPAPLLPFFTGSQVIAPDVKEITKAANKKAKTTKKQEKNYDKAVKKKPKK